MIAVRDSKATFRDVPVLDEEHAATLIRNLHKADKRRGVESAEDRYTIEEIEE